MLKFIKQFLLYGFPSLLGKLIAVFLIPVYTSVLTKEEYGAIALIISCKGVIGLVSHLEIHTGVFRDYFENGMDRKKLLSTGFFSILGSSFVVFLFLYATKTFWLHNVLGLPLEYELAFILMLISIPLACTDSFFSILTRFQKKAITFSVVSALRLIVQICTTIYCVIYLRTGICGVFIGVIAGEVLVSLTLFLVNRSQFSCCFDTTILKQVLKYSIPTLPAVLAAWVDGSLGQILISKYVSVSELGVYSLALQLTSVFILLSMTMKQVWDPYLFENYKKDNFKTEVQKLYSVLMMIVLLLTINISLLSKDIILLLSNPSYINAADYFVLLVFAMGVYLMMPFVQSGVQLTRKTKYLGLYTMIGSGINLILMLCLLPVVGIAIVPVALGVSRLVKYVLFNIYLKKHIGFSFEYKWPISLFVLVLVCYYINTLSIDKYVIWGVLALIDIATLMMLDKKYNIISTIKSRVDRR